MTEQSEFSAGRDEALGGLLRAHFASPDDAEFAVRMKALATAAAEETAWRSVARWTLPGLAAAAILLAVLGAALGGPLSPATARTVANTAAGSLVEMAGDSTPEGSVALLAVMAY
jgi:hypothetical protein